MCVCVCVCVANRVKIVRQLRKNMKPTAKHNRLLQQRAL